MSKRKEFSRTVKLKVFERAEGRCESCGTKLYAQDEKHVVRAEVDHVLPDGLGGDATEDNAQLLCHWCHKGKTKTDKSRMDKAERQKAAHLGLKTRKGQAMPGTRASGIKMKIGGGWEYRE